MTTSESVPSIWRTIDMWDPVSVFAAMWIMGAGLPDGRLSVKSTIEIREQAMMVQTISDQIQLREGL